MKTIDQTVELLDTEQQRIITTVRSLAERSWASGRLDRRARATLAQRGHFAGCPGELDFTAQDVAGHLADSATVFGARIKVIREIDQPGFGDFVTDAPDRLERYRAIGFAAALDRLVWTFQYLRAQIGEVGVDDLGREGLHEHDGEMSIAGIIDFLPQHLSDHLAQLRALSSS